MQTEGFSLDQALGLATKPGDGKHKRNEHVSKDDYAMREKTRDTIMRIPEMNLVGDNIDVKDVLEKMGNDRRVNLESLMLNRIYDSNVQIPALINKANHKAVIKVNAMGTEAAAVTELFFEAGSAAPRPPSGAVRWVDPPHMFEVTRPGVFGVVAPSGSLLFMALVNDPSQVA